MINRARVEDFETLQIQIIPSIVANEFLRNSCAQRGNVLNVSVIFIHSLEIGARSAEILRYIFHIYT